MAYGSDAVQAGHTLMLFANPRGVMGSITTDYVDPMTTIGSVPNLLSERAGVAAVAGGLSRPA